ncbi:alpha/beta hydrolase, partial [Thiopseudomonas sp. 4R-3cl]
MARRDGLGRQARSALDGIVHALKPEGMDPHLPARHLLDYVLEGPDGPRAVVAAGDPATATHLTWLVSGMGIRPQTAMWGTAREAAHLAAAQRAAGAPRPVVIGWLGYPAPTPWRVVLDGPGRRGGAMLAADVRAWWEFLRHGPGEDDDVAPALRARGTAVHGAVEAHSYGSLVAAHALRLLADRGLQPDDAEAPWPAERPVEALVVSGTVGLPATLAARAAHLGL